MLARHCGACAGHTMKRLHTTACPGLHNPVQAGAFTNPPGCSPINATRVTPANALVLEGLLVFFRLHACVHMRMRRTVSSSAVVALHAPHMYHAWRICASGPATTSRRGPQYCARSLQGMPCNLIHARTHHDAQARRCLQMQASTWLPRCSRHAVDVTKTRTACGRTMVQFDACAPHRACALKLCVH